MTFLPQNRLKEFISNTGMNNLAVLIAVLSCLSALTAFSLPNNRLPMLKSKSNKAHASSRGIEPHHSVDFIPESLVKDIDGNESIRRRFETVLRSAQV